jgi:hypothetical protein
MSPSFARSRLVSNACRPGISSLYYEEPFRSWNKIRITVFLHVSTKSWRLRAHGPHIFQSCTVRCHPSSYAFSASSSRVVPEVVLPGIELKWKLLSTHCAAGIFGRCQQLEYTAGLAKHQSGTGQFSEIHKPQTYAHWVVRVFKYMSSKCWLFFQRIALSQRRHKKLAGHKFGYVSYIASTGNMTDETERTWKETLVTQSRY